MKQEVSRAIVCLEIRDEALPVARIAEQPVYENDQVRVRSCGDLARHQACVFFFCSPTST
eukprot:scaffold358_cov343-Pavlova_lutheri.AAC.18